MSDSLPDKRESLAKRLQTAVDVFAANDEGLTLAPSNWNAMRDDMAEAARILRSIATSHVAETGEPWVPVRRKSLEWLARQDRNTVDRSYVAMEAIALAQLALAEKPDGYVASSSTERMAFSLRHLQANLPWTLPYSAHFEATAYPLDRVKHDVLHVMKSLGRIAAECENHDHGRDRKLIGDAFAKEVADIVICALHIAKLQGFDLQDAVVNNSEARNEASIPPEPIALSATKEPTQWCKSAEFGCECGRPDSEPCPLPHPRSINTLNEALRRCADYHGDDALLDAPCIFCHYSGAGYWQAGTHAENCRWHAVGGFDERRAALIRRADGGGAK